jgi:hypothetical protein
LVEIYVVNISATEITSPKLELVARGNASTEGLGIEDDRVTGVPLPVGASHPATLRFGPRPQENGPRC